MKRTSPAFRETSALSFELSIALPLVQLGLFLLVVHHLQGLEDFLHLVVRVGDHVRALAQLPDDLARHLLAGLIANAVLQRGPEVHRDGANLNFHGDEQLAVDHVNRHVHDDVQAAF